LSAARPDLPALLQQQVRLRERLRRGVGHGMQGRTAALERLEAHLKHLDPRQVLERGYAIVTDRQGEIVRSSAQLAEGSDVQMTLARGTAQARVTGTTE
jgi:exodeoxyribonuclease VII large subunit